MDHSGPCRRQHRRSTADLPVVLITTGYGSTTIASARTSDLSEGGMAVITGANLALKNTLSIEFKVPLDNVLLKLQAEVAHQRQGRYGLRFLAISEHQRDQLRKMLD